MTRVPLPSHTGFPFQHLQQLMKQKKSSLNYQEISLCYIYHDRQILHKQGEKPVVLLGGYIQIMLNNPPY